MQQKSVTKPHRPKQVQLCCLKLFMSIINYELLKLAKTLQSLLKFVFYHLKIFQSSLKWLVIINLKSKK